MTWSAFAFVVCIYWKIDFCRVFGSGSRISLFHVCFGIRIHLARGERERLFGSREREGKLKITFPFYGKGTGIRKCYGKGMGNLRLVFPGIPGNPGNHIKSKVKFKISFIFMP